MLQNLLSAGQIPETIVYAVLGFLIVIVGIAFLIFIIWLAGKIINIKRNLNSPFKRDVAVESIISPAISSDEEMNEETIAVIMAALIAYYQKENPKCEFTIRRIKKM